jgi:ectoine hydroxylase-related dioxygenase (phytanoyl-CoA dioxygenase family)
MTKDVSLFGVKEQRLTSSDFDVGLEELEVLGYTIISDVLLEPELILLRELLDEQYLQQCFDVGGEDALASINDTNTVRAPLVNHEAFLRLVAANPIVLNYVRRVLGDYFILMLQNGVINQPIRDRTPNTYSHHRDINYQHFVSSRPLSLSALFCIDDFSERTGGTIVLPGTHRHEQCPSDTYIKRNEVQVSAKAGSVLLFDSMMYHRSGINCSDKTRRGINNMYTMPFIKQQISFPSMLKGKYSSDTFLGRFLGYHSESDTSVRGFRQTRINRLKDS